jgi:hypothetical protein
MRNRDPCLDPEVLKRLKGKVEEKGHVREAVRGLEMSLRLLRK